MLTAKPHSCFSWCFYILDKNQNCIADISQKWFRERGEFYVGSECFSVGRDSFFNGTFSLRLNDSILVTARKTNVFTRTFDIQMGNDSYHLAAAHPFTRRFTLTQDGQPLGEICPLHPFTRQAKISISEEIPVAIRIFLFWLVLILWRRANNNASQG